MTRLTIIVASTRPGRVGLAVSQWFEAQAVAHGGFEIEVADLAELKLPLMDEPSHPRLRAYTRRHTKDWSAIVDASDAFAFVMPEYNHGYTAPLKNALDYLHHEWMYKPVGLVSYGGVAGGTRAVQMIKPVLAALRMVPITSAVVIPFVQDLVPEGVFKASEAMERAAAALLDELGRVEAALRSLRVAEV
jgi:NAD(P)H-dependent FMN reductase